MSGPGSLVSSTRWLWAGYEAPHLLPRANSQLEGAKLGVWEVTWTEELLLRKGGRCPEALAAFQ